ncbi:MAG: peptidyl-prolyl cis-trans isomerase [Thermoanaerobaculia bacterium]|nr:peptidyl-prolyl cis-trans isomerase [Thermoanaerobaculia bacterium]
MSVRRAGGALLVLLGVFGCEAKAPPPGPGVVARMGGVDLRLDQFEAHLDRALAEREETLNSEALSRLFDQFLTETLLTRLAVDRALVPAGVGAAEAADALLGSEPVGTPGEAELQAWFEAHREELRRPERVELAQILTSDRITAERARREVAAGADFTEVARRLSEDPAADTGGQHGVFAREDLPTAFADIVFQLPEGGLSEVIAADYGFHVFRVLRRFPAAEPTAAAVRQEAMARLRAERADAALARLVGEARSRYAVEVFDRSLPFAYRGDFPTSRPYEKR